MRTMYHPHWGERIHWHDIVADKRLWALIVIVGFIALFILLVIMSPRTGQTPPVPYYGPWPPYGPVPIR